MLIWTRVDSQPESDWRLARYTSDRSLSTLNIIVGPYIYLCVSTF